MRAIILPVGLLMSLFACAGQPPQHLGIHQGKFAPCPDKPNCVSSDTTTPSQRIAPLPLTQPADAAWPRVIQAVQSLPRTRIITQTGNYLHAECRSAVFGFVDDLELHLRPQEQLIAVRSAARLGYSDFDVNRKRVQQLRELITRSASP